jgi:protein SCO1/2
MRAALPRVLAGLLAVVLGASAYPAVAGEDQRPAILRDVAFDQRLGAEVPLDVAFRDETGARVTLRDYLGDKPVLLVPAYYECPMLCTIVLNGVVSALRALPFDVGKEFRVVTFSFNPRETSELAAAKKATYLEDYRRPGAAAGWHFLVGDEPSIAALTQAIGFRYAWDAESKQYAHASGIVVLTPGGRISHYFFGVEFAPRDLRLALVEASGERIGSLVDQLLLFCFHYDPETGRYSRVALNAVRAGGVLTLAVLGAFVGLMLRRDAARARRPPARPREHETTC